MMLVKIEIYVNLGFAAFVLKLCYAKYTAH